MIKVFDDLIVNNVVRVLVVVEKIGDKVLEIIKVFFEVFFVLCEFFVRV